VLEEFLPDISLRFVEFVLRHHIANKYTEVWEILSPYAEISEASILHSPTKAQNRDVSHDSAKNLEAIRLLAIYKRLQADIVGAERYSYLYYKYFKPDIEKRAQLVTHANATGYPASELLKNWSAVLEECDTIQAEIFKQAGLENSTCEYFECSDCCKHTFPVMSYTEFVYLRDWLRKNNYPIAELEKRCSEIQNQYEEQYGSRLTVLDKNLPENNIRGIENPHNFKYSCPFLSANGRCSCYAARPLLCRGFGLSTDNGISTKSCQYYIEQYQHGASAEGDRDVYDLRQVQTLARASDRYLTKKENNAEKVLSGTIVAWFSRMSS
jgi:Fe-S-cluster containining protein